MAYLELPVTLHTSKEYLILKKVLHVKENLDTLPVPANWLVYQTLSH